MKITMIDMQDSAGARALHKTSSATMLGENHGGKVPPVGAGVQWSDRSKRSHVRL